MARKSDPSINVTPKLSYGQAMPHTQNDLNTTNPPTSREVSVLTQRIIAPCHKLSQLSPA
ncbi:hypothetical protein EMIT0P43_30081 [Pseudomonas jessenii]